MVRHVCERPTGDLALIGAHAKTQVYTQLLAPLPLESRANVLIHAVTMLGSLDAPVGKNEELVAKGRPVHQYRKVKHGIGVVNRNTRSDTKTWPDYNGSKSG